MVINSRVMRVDQSSLLKDVLALVTSEDDVHRLASVQTGSDAGSCYNARPKDDVQLHLEFGRHHFVFHLAAAEVSRSAVETLPRSTVSEVLSRNARELRLPKPPTSGAGGTTTAMDCCRH